MLHSFPEALFMPIQNKEDYITRVYEGEKIAKRKKVFICGLVRQAEKYASYFLNRVEKIRSMFCDSMVVLYENDSTDNTVQIIKNFIKSDREKHFSYNLLSENLSRPRHVQNKSLKRRADMAYYRNRYLSEFPLADEIVKFDYMIVLDSDICGGYSYEGILNSISWMDTDKYHALGSNSLLYRERDGVNERLYFDAWAYRELGAGYHHSTTEVNQKLQLYRGQSPYEVNSCFGGLAIYDASFIRKHKFEYEDSDCDHVTLHNQMRKAGAKIGINPSQIVLYSPTLYTFSRSFE